MDAEVEARAYGGVLDGRYDHALLSPSALGLVAEGTRSTDELIHDLHLFKRITVDEDGTIIVEKGATIAHREPAGEVTDDEDRGDRRPAELPLVGESVQALLESGDTGVGEELELVLSLNQLDWNPVVSVEHELMVAMIEGRVDTRRDALTVRHEAMVAREAAGAEALEPLLGELVALEGLAHLDAAEEDSVSAGYPNGTEVTGVHIDGEEVENLLQTTQFYSAGYYGDSDGYIGLEEGGASSGGHMVRRSHLGFDDGAGADRWTNCGAPSTIFCSANPLGYRLRVHVGTCPAAPKDVVRVRPESNTHRCTRTRTVTLVPTWTTRSGPRSRT